METSDLVIGVMCNGGFHLTGFRQRVAEFLGILSLVFFVCLIALLCDLLLPRLETLILIHLIKEQREKPIHFSYGLVKVAVVSAGWHGLNKYYPSCVAL